LIPNSQSSKKSSKPRENSIILVINCNFKISGLFYRLNFLLFSSKKRKQEAGSRKQEAGSRKQEAGSYFS
jgi:hypothetical protein